MPIKSLCFTYDQAMMMPPMPPGAPGGGPPGKDDWSEPPKHVGEQPDFDEGEEPDDDDDERIFVEIMPHHLRSFIYLLYPICFSTF